MEPTKKLIYTKMMDIMKEIEPIKKMRKNKLQNFMFRGIEDMYNTLQSLFVKHGVFATPKVLSFEKETIEKDGGKYMFLRYYTIEYTFWAPDGSNLIISVPGEGADYSDKGTGKAMSNAHKYALIQIFMIPTEDSKDSDEAEEEINTSRAKLEEDVVKYIGSSKWAQAKKEAVIKGLKSHADDYLQGVLNGKLD